MLLPRPVRVTAYLVCEEEEFVFPFVVQAAATSARVPRAGIVVPLRRKRTGCGRWCGDAALVKAITHHEVVVLQVRCDAVAKPRLRHPVRVALPPAYI